MFVSFFRCPSSLSTCGAAICAGLVLLMQHITPCALWLEEHLYAVSLNCSARAVAPLLQQAGDVAGLERLDRAEKELAGKVLALLGLPLSEDVGDLRSSPPDCAESLAAQRQAVTPPERENLATPAPATTPAQSCEALAETPARPTRAEGAAQAPTPLAQETADLFVPERPAAVETAVESPAQPSLAPPRHEPESPQTAQSGGQNAQWGEWGMVEALEYALSIEGRGRSTQPTFRVGYPRMLLRHGQIGRQNDISPRTSKRMAKIGTGPRSYATGRKTPTTASDAQAGDALPGAAGPMTQNAPRASALVSGETPPLRCRILMLGDSLMEDLGPMTHRLMRHRKGLEFIISAKYSTGLCRPDYFNWPEHMSSVVLRYAPDLVIFFIGANDGMPIRQGKRLVPTGGEPWRAAYAAKMEELVNMAQGAEAGIIWVEMPAVGGRYNKLLHDTQVAQRSFCESRGIISLRTDDFLSGTWGHFEPYGDYHGRYTRLRTKDMTHLTKQGNMKVLEHLLPLVEQRLAAFYARRPERRLSAEEAASIRRVPVVYTCQYTPPRPKKSPAAPPAPQPRETPTPP